MPPSHLFRFLCALLVCATFAPPGPTAAQEAGAAVISFPRQGEPVAGLIGITGTATHPQFEHYELAFAYDPNPTNTWFPIGEPGLAPVGDGPLAEWDLTGITDGTYALRLRVFGLDGSLLEAVVGGVIVQNNPPTPTPAPASPTPEALLEATATFTPEGLIQQPPTSTPRPALESTPAATPTAGPISGRKIRSSFCGGAALTGGLFVVIGLYAALRATLRPHFRRWMKRLLDMMQR